MFQPDPHAFKQTLDPQRKASLELGSLRYYPPPRLVQSQSWSVERTLPNELDDSPTLAKEELYKNEEPCIIMGMPNIGNTFYMNTVFQFLYNQKGFMNELQKAFDCIPPEKFKSNLILFWFLKVYTLVENNVPVEMQDILYLKSMIGLKNQIYNNFKEHDAFDFLIDLLKMLHVELNFNKIKSQDFNNSTTEESNIEEKYLEFLSFMDFTEDTIIMRNFGGVYLITYQCAKCLNRLFMFEPFFHLDLYLKEQGGIVKSTQDIINESFTDEPIKGYYCCKCKSTLKGLKRISIMKTPKILIAKVERYRKAGKLQQFFTQSQYSKNRIPININLPLDLNQVLSKQINRTEKYEDFIFHLTAVISHQGDYESGKYQLYTESEKGWLHLDQKFIYQVLATDLLTTLEKNKHAYVLLYKTQLNM